MRAEASQPQPFRPANTLRVLWVGLLAVAGSLWLFFAGAIGFYIATADFPTRFEYVYQLRDDVVLDEIDIPRPLYDLARSPAAEKLPVRFVRAFRTPGIPDLRMHEGGFDIVEFKDGARLYLGRNLSAADRSYLTAEFDKLAGERRIAWLQRIGSWLAIFLLPPLFLAGAIWAGRRFKIPEAPAPQS
jgi:hypothetical protein